MPVLDRFLMAGVVLVMGVRGVMVWRGFPESTVAMVIGSLLMFAACVSSAVHLLGARSAFTFVGIAVVLGWFFEDTGAAYGWWFGHYHYTRVLGWKLGEVPVVIPLMWFALTYMGFLIANLIMWRSPVQPQIVRQLIQGRFGPLVDALLLSVPAALIVVGYDLGADPYMVHIGAWTLPSGIAVLDDDGGVLHLLVAPNHGYFKETIQGFRGWFFAAFCIVLAFRLTRRKALVVPTNDLTLLEALVPVLVFGGLMAFQIVDGHPIETRSIAVIAMGIPFTFALTGWNYWRLENLREAR